MQPINPKHLPYFNTFIKKCTEAYQSFLDKGEDSLIDEVKSAKMQEIGKAVIELHIDLFRLYDFNKDNLVKIFRTIFNSFYSYLAEQKIGEELIKESEIFYYYFSYLGKIIEDNKELSLSAPINNALKELGVAFHSLFTSVTIYNKTKSN